MIQLIKDKIKIRQDYWNQYENSRFTADEEYHKIEEPKEIDILGDEILDLLLKNHEGLPVDFVLESLTHLGYDVSMIYDDNGHFAISKTSYGSVSLEMDDYAGTYVIEKNCWGSTIREAIDIYFKNLTN